MYFDELAVGVGVALDSDLVVDVVVAGFAVVFVVVLFVVVFVVVVAFALVFVVVVDFAVVLVEVEVVVVGFSVVVLTVVVVVAVFTIVVLAVVVVAVEVGVAATEPSTVIGVTGYGQVASLYIVALAGPYVSGLHPGSCLIGVCWYAPRSSTT